MVHSHGINQLTLEFETAINNADKIIVGSCMAWDGGGVRERRNGCAGTLPACVRGLGGAMLLSFLYFFLFFFIAGSDEGNNLQEEAMHGLMLRRSI